MEHVSVQGVDLPKIGLGTWRQTGDDCRRAVATALELGYRHIDTAQIYGNERQVGEALRASDVDRDEVFLATKLEGGNRDYDGVLRSTEESLARLGTDYLDLLLIHWPNRRTPLRKTIDAMNELVDRGTVENIGVSNFDLDLLAEAREFSSAQVLTDQVQFHPYWDQTELLDYCSIHDLALTAYSPLGHGGVLEDEVIRAVADDYGKSPAQVALRWAIQHENVVAVPKATSREHLAANLEVFDFELSDEEMERIRRPSKLRTLSNLVRSRLSV